MTNPNQVPSPEVFTPEQFLADLERVRECFPLVGGMIGGHGEIYDVTIGGYHAPMTDFFDDDTLNEHFRASSNAATVDLPLEISPNFRYAFDNGQEWFRIGRGAFLHIAERKVPVSIVRLDFEGFSSVWLYRDEKQSVS